MAYAWDPAKDSATPSWTYTNDDRDASRPAGGNYLCIGTDDTEFDTGDTGGLVFEIELINDGSATPNGQSLFGFGDDATQSNTSTTINPGVKYSRSGTLIVDGTTNSTGNTTISAGDYITFYIKSDTFYIRINDVDEIGTVASETGGVSVSNDLLTPMCNPRLSSGSARWRLNTTSAQINATIPSGWSALESTGGGGDPDPLPVIII